MSISLPIADSLEGHAGKQRVAGSIPGGAYIIILKFSLTERCSQNDEDHTNEIKHDIHPG